MMLLKSKVLETAFYHLFFSLFVCLFVFFLKGHLRFTVSYRKATRANFKKRTPIAHKNNTSTNLLKKVSYCTFQKHANSEVQKAAFTFSFFSAVNHNTITSNEPCNTETHKTYRNPSVIREVTNHDLLNLLM